MSNTPTLDKIMKGRIDAAMRTGIMPTRVAISIADADNAAKELGLSQPLHNGCELFGLTVLRSTYVHEMDIVFD